ncbi:MAG: AsmA family protein [Ascidiaceihabitans sp.]|jgi:AsmA protein|nr:AsmA family protein [Ascidiaceihabitans sp.]
MKIIGRIIGALLLIAVVAVVSLLFLPADRIARLAAEQIKAQTGREVSITGDVSMTLWPVLGVSAGEIEVGNADWARQGSMLTARNAAIGIDAMALLSGEIKITNIEAASPTIRLESRKDGRASWVFTDASGEAAIETETAPDREAQAFSLQKLTVTDATLIYDAEGSDLVSYSGVDLALDWPERLGAADIQATLRPAGADVDVVATINGFAGFIAGDVQPIVARIKTSGGSLSLKGRASTAGDVAGRLGLKLSDTDAFLRALGLDGADLPRGLGRSVDMDADLTLTSDRRLSLRGMQADLDGNTITGAADVSLNGTPQFNAQISAGALDLKGATQGDNSSASSAGSVGTGWPKDRIDASGLAAFNGEIALTASSIDLGSFQLGKTRALIKNDRSRMVFEMREVQAYDGTVSGEFVMNNRGGLSVGGKIFAKSVSVQKVLRDAMDVERLTGNGDAEISFLGSGSNVDAIMRSLSGNGALRLGQGTIQGLDLNTLMGSGNGSGGTTVFDSLGATFTINAGNLRNDDLLFVLPNYEARGKGRVGLGAQEIDYLFTPAALRANSGKGIAIPVSIKGPWSNPRIQPDLEAAINLNLAEEKAKLKEKAKALEDDTKARAQEKLEKELGVSTEDGQSVEDAVKKKLEDKLKGELFKLFD